MAKKGWYSWCDICFLCASCGSRLEPDSYVDVYCTCWLLRAGCSPAVLPALSRFLSSFAAAHCASQCSGWSQPAAGAGSVRPQPAAAHALSGYNLKLLTRQTVSPIFSCIYHNVFFFGFVFMSAGHWFVNQCWACFKVRRQPAAPLPLAPCDIVEPQKQSVSSCHSRPPSSTPQKWVCRVHYILSMRQSKFAIYD